MVGSGGRIGVSDTKGGEVVDVGPATGRITSTSGSGVISAIGFTITGSSASMD